MKQRAIDVAIGKVARSLALVEWKTFDKGKFKKDEVYYHLNVQPNVNQNATDFWEEVVRKLFYEDREVLIVVTDDDQFVVADDYIVQKFILKENIYKNVRKDDFVFERPFYESKVIRLNYRNLNLRKILNELDKSYGKLFERLVQVSMRRNQIRGTAKLTGSLAKNEKAQKFLQTFVDKLFSVFSNKSVAIAPTQDGMEYQEHSKETNPRSDVDELNKVSDEYLNAVLEVVGIHPSLINGDMSDVAQHQDNYILNVVQPLVEQATDELNRKFYYPSEFMGGTQIKSSLVKLRFISVFDMGAASEKMVGSAAFTPNEVREAGGYDRIDDATMDMYYLTKNIEPLKGGGEDKQETGTNDNSGTD